MTAGTDWNIGHFLSNVRRRIHITLNHTAIPAWGCGAITLRTGISLGMILYTQYRMTPDVFKKFLKYGC